jgi:hypothetical protein
MKSRTHADTCELLGLPTSTSEQEPNPLRVALSYEIDNPEPPIAEADYRQRAINRCVLNGVGFTSEDNTAFTLLCKYVQIKCPRCGLTMKSGDGGGAGGVYSVKYKCDCGTTASISIPAAGIGFAFPERQFAEGEQVVANTDLISTFTPLGENPKAGTVRVGSQGKVVKVHPPKGPNLPETYSVEFHTPSGVHKTQTARQFLAARYAGTDPLANVTVYEKPASRGDHTGGLGWVAQLFPNQYWAGTEWKFRVCTWGDLQELETSLKRHGIPYKLDETRR